MDLAERIDEIFCEIDSDIVAELRKWESYAAMLQEKCELDEKYPIIEQVYESEGAISLTAEEHTTVVHSLDMKMDTEEAERRQIYYWGYTDGFAYP